MATSFVVDTEAFASSFAQLLDRDDAVVLVAGEAAAVVGYLLGFDHLAFYANGRVAYVEEVAVREDLNEGPRSVGNSCGNSKGGPVSRSATLITVATRRAAPFYRRVLALTRRPHSSGRCS